MKQESPVFIVGAARSGTSILYNRLQHHSSFKVTKLSRVQLSESCTFSEPYKTYDISNHGQAKNRSLGYMLRDQVYYQQFLDSVSSIQKYHQTILPVVKFVDQIASKSNTFRQVAWKMLLKDCLMHSYFYHAKQARGVKRLLEKTPIHIHRLPEIKVTFPRGKLLFIYRHPLEVYSSYKRRLQVHEQEENADPKLLKWLQISPTSFCDQYAGYIHLAQREHLANPSGFMWFKYEDFTSNPQTMFEQICEFINEPYEAAMITELDEPKEWKQDPHLFKPITKNTKDWQDFASEADAKFIEDRLEPIMQQLNYQRYT